MSLGRFRSRTALVTGAASGIGRAIARGLADGGATVAVADIDEVGAAATVEAIATSGGAALALRTDVADPASVAAAASVVGERLAGLDILVNNAAVVDTLGFEDASEEHYRRVMAVNIDGAVLVTKAMLPLLKKSRAARVVNIASIMGLRGSRGGFAYSTAKGALVNLTRTLACDLAAEDILVNAVAPGFIDTPMCVAPDGSHEHDAPLFRDIYLEHRRIPLARAGLPDDVAGPVLFLCSDEARYVTGQILSVDGGLSATF